MVMVDTDGVRRQLFRDQIADIALRWSSGELDGVTDLYNAADSVAYDVIQYAVQQVGENKREPEDPVQK